MRSRRRHERPESSPEHELALLLCQIEPVREQMRPRIAELAAVADYDELGKVLYRNGVLGACGYRLERLCPETVPHPFVEMLDWVAAGLRPRAALLEIATTGLLHELEAAGVPALPLKGVLLASRIHGATPLRPSTDIDILVPRAALPAAREVIQAAGYAPPDDVPLVDGLPNLHYCFESVTGEAPPVDLHWRVHWFETAFSEGMLQRSALGEDGIRRAAPADEFAALLLFYQRDSFLGLKLAADISAWWDRYGAELPPRALEPLLCAHPELRDALLASAAVASRLMGVPAPGLLGAPPLHPRRTARAARLIDWRSRDPNAQGIANLGLIDWLLTPKGGQWAFVRRYILQPARMFAREHGLPEEPRPRHHIRRYGHAVARVGKTLMRLALATWSTRGGRFVTPLPGSLAARPLPLQRRPRRKNPSEPAVVETCSAIRFGPSDSQCGRTLPFPESEPMATTDSRRG
jgi:putative nucleotidyltransferase-like protein